MLARPQERPITELWGAEKLILQNERNSDAQRSGMLISDPLGEGSNASSTDRRATKSSGERTHPQMRGNSDARRSGMLIVPSMVRGAC